MPPWTSRVARRQSSAAAIGRCGGGRRGARRRGARRRKCLGLARHCPVLRPHIPETKNPDQAAGVWMRTTDLLADCFDVARKPVGSNHHVAGKHKRPAGGGQAARARPRGSPRIGAGRSSGSVRANARLPPPPCPCARRSPRPGPAPPWRHRSNRRRDGQIRGRKPRSRPHRRSSRCSGTPIGAPHRAGGTASPSRCRRAAPDSRRRANAPIGLAERVPRGVRLSSGA